MNKLRELDNPYAMGIDAIYYKGEMKKAFLEKRKQVLSQIQQDNILGFGYTFASVVLHDECSIEDIVHSNYITEYVFMKNSCEEDADIYFEMISQITFSENDKDLSAVQLEDYINELENNGCIMLPINFRQEKSFEDMKKELSSAKHTK